MPHGSAAIEACAEQLFRARSRRRLLPTPAAHLAGVAEAYLVQDAVALRHGGVSGWKVGAKARDAVPTCAPLVRGSIVDADGEIAVGSEHIGVELEIAFRTARPFPAGATEPGMAEIRDSIGSAHIAIELCRSRLTEGPLAPPLWLLADCQMNHTLVLGDEIRAWDRIAFDRLSAQLSIDGTLVDDSIGGHPAGNPLNLLAWLVRHVIHSRGGLAAGSIVTTGSWTGLRWIKPAALIRGEFAGAAGLTVALATGEAGREGGSHVQ